MAEVERGEVEEIEDQDDFSPVEVRSDKEHDEGKMEEVVEDEVAANARSSIDDVGVAREEMSNIAGLEDEEHNPVRQAISVIMKYGGSWSALHTNKWR